jgi:predicted nucleotidyltransferase
MFDFNFRHLVNRGLRPIGEKQREEAFTQVIHYVQQNQDEMQRVLETEVDVSVEKEHYILTGKIDLLLGGDGKLELLDFYQALQAAQERISKEFTVHGMVLFGSVARGTSDEESDVDLLIVLKESSSHEIRKCVSSIILDINLDYDTNLNNLIVDQDAWDEGPLFVLPIYAEIQQQGIRL